MDFTGYDKLNLSEQERKILASLHRLSSRNKIEYGCAICGGVVSEVFTSHDANAVQIPADVLSKSDISLYHSHTNDTLLSTQDLALLVNENINCVAVIAAHCDIAIASIGTGIIPSKEEFYKIANTIRHEVDIDLLNDESFWEMTIEERNTCAINFQCYRIARHFKWNLKGGIL